MTPLRVLLVDGEAGARSRLRALLEKCESPAAAVGAEAGDAVRAMELLHYQRFDLVMLDVRLPGSDGLTLARAIRQRPQPQPVVFVAAHAGHAVQAFDVGAVDYLTKPVRFERLQQALQRVARQGAAREPSAEGEMIVIPQRERVLRLPVSQVVYFKAEQKYVTVRTVANSYLLAGTLSGLQARFADRFLRVHRNALVAVRALRALTRPVAGPRPEEGWQLQLEGVPEALEVSRRQLAAVREAFRTRR